MTPERLQQIETIYTDALPLRSGERAPFLEQACGKDAELRKEVESLLAFEQQTESYMNTPAFEQAAHSIASEGGDTFMDRMLGRYQLLSLVGQGGMGQVYCAVDSRLNRLVAVKVLPSYMSSDAERVRRFEQEARATAALNHPNICTLHDVGHDNDLHYLVFEYLAGEPLSRRLADGALPLPEAMRYALQIAEALESAHDQGVIHLDLKPSNIMLMKSGVKLLDFGIAELRHPDDLKIDEERAIRPQGTLGYMAPEQLNALATDARTDIFAFGVVLYEILTGQRAFPSNRMALAFRAVVPPPIPDVPEALNAVIMRCLEHDPADRWQSMEEVQIRLRHGLGPFRHGPTLGGFPLQR